jgi:cation:H+ antiporter
MPGIVLFCAGVVVSLAASWLLVSRLERLGERAGFSEAWLGLVAALAADAPEITSSVTALARGQASVGAGVVIGSNVFNLAALLGLAAVVAGWIGFHRRVVVLSGVPAVWVAAVCLLTVAAVVSPAAGLALAAVVLVPYVAVLGMRRARLERLRLPAGWVRWLVAAVHEEEAELAEAIRPRPGTWRDAVAAMAALVVVVGASTVMEVAATAVGGRYGVADIVTGVLVLAVVTSLPNAVSAVYLALRGRGAAVLSTALNSNAINVVAGLLIPAALAGLGPRSGPGFGQGTLVAARYAGLTVLALALAYRGRGLGPRVWRGDHRGIPGVRDRPDRHRATRRNPRGHSRVPGRRHGRGRCAAADLAGPVADGGCRDGRPVAAGVGAARVEHRPPVAAQPDLVRRGGGVRRGQWPARDPDRPAGHRPVLCAADRPVGADRRGQRLGRGARGGAGRTGPDLCDLHPVRVPGRRRGRQDDRDRQRGGSPAPASMIAAQTLWRAARIRGRQRSGHPGMRHGT